MKGLASFVMRGRLQALLVTMAGAGSIMFCWISAAVVALVTLRRGVGPGAGLLAWALLPAGTLMLVFGDSSPLMLLVGTAVMAMVLRLTVSLSLSMLVAVAVGAVSGLGLLIFGETMLAQLVTLFDEFLGNMERQLASGSDQAVSLVRPTALQIAGMLATANAMLSALCLLLARWWQAELYKPGGFGGEFRSLYYPPVVSALLALAALGLAALGTQYRSWGALCLVPLMFAGLALVHARAALKGQGKGSLIAFYLAWLFFDPVKFLVVFAAIVDSWLNFRQRWAAKAVSPVDKQERDEDQD